MSQLTIAPQTYGDVRGARRRTMRNTRIVTLRSSLPTGLVTLRHDVPEYLPEFLHEPTEEAATSKVDPAGGAERTESSNVETTVGKGGEAQW
jgi:hypothetical protein